MSPDTYTIMELANARPLSISGIQVKVSGSLMEFAQVVIADRKHPLFGWRAEYTWQAIERAAKGSGELQ